MKVGKAEGEAEDEGWNGGGIGRSRARMEQLWERGERASSHNGEGEGGGGKRRGTGGLEEVQQ